jgi:hypothetical protein
MLYATFHKSHEVSKRGSTPPSDGASSIIITDACTDVDDAQVVANTETVPSLHLAPTLVSRTDQAEHQIDPAMSPVLSESVESLRPLNFFPSALLKARKLPVRVVTVSEDDDDSLSEAPFSTTSTLTTREERVGYSHNLAALQVQRPVARYPPEEKPPDAPLLFKNSSRSSGSLLGENRVPSPHPGTFAAAPTKGNPSQVAQAASSGIIIVEEDQSLAVISDTSSFDGTYDDTLTSGYLSAGGAFGKCSSLVGDDWTELSILLPAHQSFDESLEDGASVERLLPSPKTSSVVSKLMENEPVPLDRRSIILSPALSSSIPLESCLLSSSSTNKETKTTCVKKVAFAKVVVSQLHPVSVGITQPLLFVTEDRADSLCRANGGLYSILLASGFDVEARIEMRAASISKQSNQTALKLMRLSPDFRCGAQGSTYDICVQSGFDLSTPWQWTKKRKFLPVRGGLFDMAQRSGLTKDKLHSRGPLVIKTIPLSLYRHDDTEVLPEDVTDYECGATGNLYLAFESGGGDYVSKGSLYYLATRSGFKLNQ